VLIPNPLTDSKSDVSDLWTILRKKQSKGDSLVYFVRILENQIEARDSVFCADSESVDRFEIGRLGPEIAAIN
jgi:hypothetical protein